MVSWCAFAIDAQHEKSHHNQPVHLELLVPNVLLGNSSGPVLESPHQLARAADLGVSNKSTRARSLPPRAGGPGQNQWERGWGVAEFFPIDTTP